MISSQVFQRSPCALQRICSLYRVPVLRSFSNCQRSNPEVSSKVDVHIHLQSSIFQPHNPTCRQIIKCSITKPAKDMIDLPASRIIAPLILPTLLKDKALVYISPLSIIEKTDPLESKEIGEQNQGAIVPKEAAKMIRIRGRKMRKHKLKKLRKKMHFEWAKVRFRREKAKEQAFQAQLLTQIREAEIFDAEKYVHDALKRIRDRPKPETVEERNERILELRRKNRSNVNVIRPKFEDI